MMSESAVEISSNVNAFMALIKLFIVEYSQNHPILALILVTISSSLIFTSLLIPYKIYTIKHTTIRSKHILEYKLDIAKVNADTQIKMAELKLNNTQEKPNE